MNGTKRDLLLVIVLLLFLSFYVTETFGQINVNSNATATTNYDEIETQDGTRCRQALGSNLNLELGVGQTAEEEYLFDDFGNNNNQNGQAALFARVTYALGGPKRLECSYLYELELMRLRMELLELQSKTK